MKTRPKIYVVVALFLCFAALVWAQTEYKWSEKLATLTVGSMNGDAMFMVLVDPNGTPASGLIGQTEALANWVGSTAVTTLGTIATGTWQATDVGVPYGGTGVSTLTDGGILLGSGTGAITALGVATNGQIPIGDGTTDPVLATISEGLMIDIVNGAGTITIAFDPNEVTGGTTWDDGGEASVIWTWNLAAGDPSVTFGNGVVNVSSGTLQQGGTGVSLTTHNHTGTYEPADPNLTAIAGLTTSADTLNYWTGAGTTSLTNFTAFGRSIVDDASEAAFKATVNLEIGTDVQAYDPNLTGIAAVNWASGQIVQSSGSGNFQALTQNAGTDITADLEEETHASEHQDAGGDEIAVTAGMMNAGAGASATTFWRGDNTWGTPAGAGDMLKSTYDVSNDGHVDGNDVVYAAAWNGDVNAPSMNAVYDQMETKGALAGQVWTGAHDFGGATSVEVPNAESADATMTALGQLHIRGDEDRISAHLGAGGEIAGEATMSWLKRISVTLDPGSWYDSSPYVNLGPILAKQYPNGIIIDYWQVTCHLDPDVEMDLDLCYSVNDFDFPDPNVVDVMDTTAGRSSEDTDANINAGAAVPAGVYLYLRFGADPEGTCVMLTVTILYHAEED